MRCDSEIIAEIIVIIVWKSSFGDNMASFSCDGLRRTSCVNMFGKEFVQLYFFLYSISVFFSEILHLSLTCL